MLKTVIYILGCVLTLAEARKFDNPVIDGGDYPDPGVILHEGIYYAVTTTGSQNYEKYPIHTSTDLQNWTLIGYLFNQSNFPSWSQPNFEFWAPEIHQIGDEFRVYFSARDIQVNQLSIGVATSKSVAGPYTVLPRPLLAIPGVLVIDATLIKQNDTLMLAFVEDYYIRVRNLTADGLALKDDITVPLFKPELDWEGPTTEGPWYMFRNDYHYIFYSGNDFCTDRYALGVARSRSPAGPYEKYPEPLLVSNEQFKGPGHGSIVRDVVNDGWAFVHHGWKAGAVCGPNFRLMFTTSMEWGDDDWPLKMSIGN